MAIQQTYGPQLPKAPLSGSYGPEPKWDSKKKKQFLLTHGYNEGQAQSLMMGGNPMQKQAPQQKAVQPAAMKKGMAVHPDAYEAGKAQGQTPDYIADQMALNSPHFASQLKKIRTKFGNDPAATEAFLNTRFYGDTNYSPSAPPEKGGIVKRTLDRIYGNAQDILGQGGIMDHYNQGQLTSGQAALRSTQKIISGAAAPITELSSTIVKGAYNNIPGVKEGLQYAGSQIAGSDIGQAVAPYIQQGVDAYQNLPQGSGFRDLAAAGQVGIDALDVLGTAGAVQLGKRAVTQGATHPFQTVRHPIQSGKAVWNGPQAPAPVNQPKELIGKAREAVDKGMDEKFMTFVAEQNPDTRGIMSKMTIAAKEGGEKLGGTVKHKEILGGQMMENAAYVLEQKQMVGKALGAMKASVADDIVDLSDDYQTLLGQLRNKGAVLNDKGKIISLAGAADDNIPLLQKTLDFLQPDEAGRVARRGKEIDMWRAKLFEEMNSAKAKLQPSAAGQSTFGFAEKVTNDMRRSALVRMAKGNGNMVALNDAFEDLSTNASRFLKSIGYKGKLDIDSITAKQLRAGEIAMRALGNASADSREAFMTLIQTAKKYGRISNVDELALIRYADALEDVFPITPTRSLAGQVSRGTRDAAGNLIEDIAGGGSIKMGILNRVSEPVMKVYDQLRGLTPENRFRLLMEVLDSPPETPLFNIIDDVLPDEVADDLSVQGVDAGDMKPIANEALKGEFKNLTPEEYANLTPEEKATGLIGGSDSVDDVSLSLKGGQEGRPGIDYPAPTSPQAQAQKSVNGSSVVGMENVKNGDIIDLDLSKIDTSSLEPKPRPFPEAKRPITDPIEVTVTVDGQVILNAGNHRYHQAIFNGDRTIPAKIRLEKAPKEPARSFSQLQQKVADLKKLGWADSALTYIDDSGTKRIKLLKPEELALLKDEVKAIPQGKGGSQIHLDALSENLLKSGNIVSDRAFMTGHPQIGQVLKRLRDANPIDPQDLPF